MRYPKIIEAEYIEEYKIKLTFNDGIVKVLDFFDLLKNSHYPNEKKYLNIDTFKQFKVDYGDLIWNDFDMCFQGKNLYKNKLR